MNLTDLQIACCKVPELLATYDRLLLPFRDRPIRILELGIAAAGSIQLWQAYFSAGDYWAVDDSEAACARGRAAGATVGCLDQGDRQGLTELAQRAGSFDLIIDDCSHIGNLARASFEVLFPFLKSGGLYLIEDWGTGYWSHWPDGAAYQEGHGAGMVGFVKWLVDQVGAPDRGEASEIAWLEIRNALAVVRKK